MKPLVLLAIATIVGVLASALLLNVLNLSDQQEPPTSKEYEKATVIIDISCGNNGTDCFVTASQVADQFPIPAGVFDPTKAARNISLGTADCVLLKTRRGSSRNIYQVECWRPLKR